ncbi:MAG: ABC transporter permease [Candidatus Binatia bacterium]
MSEARDLAFRRDPDGRLVVHMAGPWRLRDGLPAPAEVERAVGASPSPGTVVFDATALGEWDSSLVAFLVGLLEQCAERGIAVDRAGLPSGVQRLVGLAQAVPEKKDARVQAAEADVLERIGLATIAVGTSVREVLAFVGEITAATGRLLRGRARFRRSDLFVLMQQAGVEALPIVTLISFLVGLILAFVGAVQLEQFGAAIYVANLVGVAMVREMGAMMTGIVMAGRTGASYAAQIGSMKVSQEIDALTTMGIAPLEFLVLPRMIALCLMMPLLCLYSDGVGVLGGAAVGIGMLDVSFVSYFQQTATAVKIVDLVGGVCKASVYGVLIAIAGSLRGLQTGGSAAAVGDSTTAAVVTSIIWIISACGVFAVLFYILGI